MAYLRASDFYFCDGLGPTLGNRMSISLFRVLRSDSETKEQLHPRELKQPLHPRGFFGFRIQGSQLGVSENRGPQYSTLNSRILIIRPPIRYP